MPVSMGKGQLAVRHLLSDIPPAMAACISASEHP